MMMPAKGSAPVSKDQVPSQPAAERAGHPRRLRLAHLSGRQTLIRRGYLVQT